MDAVVDFFFFFRSSSPPSKWNRNVKWENKNWSQVENWFFFIVYIYLMTIITNRSENWVLNQLCFKHGESIVVSLNAPSSTISVIQFCCYFFFFFFFSFRSNAKNMITFNLYEWSKRIIDKNHTLLLRILLFKMLVLLKNKRNKLVILRKKIPKLLLIIYVQKSVVELLPF